MFLTIHGSHGRIVRVDLYKLWSGAVAQLGERLVRIEEVKGSNPFSSIADMAICRF